MKTLLTFLFILVASTTNLNFAQADTASVELRQAKRPVTLSGFTRARSTIKLSSEVAGKVSHVNAEIGEAIPENGVFACIDDTFVNIDIKSAQNAIVRHQVDVEFFKKQVGRHKQLVAQKSAALTVLDELERQLAVSQRELQSDLLQKQRLLETKRRHCISAPPGWLVADRKIEPGQWINVGEPVGEVGNFFRLMVPLALTHTELATLKDDIDHLTLTLPEYDLSVKPKIERISPAFDEQTRKILVDLVIEETLPENRGGIRANLTLELPEEEGIFLISKKALDQRFEQFWLRRTDGTNIRVEYLGTQGQEWVKVTSPELKEGDHFKIIHP